MYRLGQLSWPKECIININVSIGTYLRYVKTSYMDTKKSCNVLLCSSPFLYRPSSYHYLGTLSSSSCLFLIYANWKKAASHIYAENACAKCEINMRKKTLMRNIAYATNLLCIYKGMRLKAIQFFLFHDDSFTRDQPQISVTGHWRFSSYANRPNTAIFGFSWKLYLAALHVRFLQTDNFR